MKFILFVSSKCIYSLKLIEILNTKYPKWRDIFYIYDLSEKWLFEAVKNNNIIKETPTLEIISNDNNINFVIGMEDILNVVETIQWDNNSSAESKKQDNEPVPPTVDDSESDGSDAVHFSFSSNVDNNENNNNNKPKSKKNEKSLAEALQLERDENLKQKFGTSKKRG